MIENLDFLFKRMKASRPVLLLGAGFSYGATNANNTPLLLGKKLSQELHKYFFVEGELSTLDPTMLSEINDKEDDLKEICSYLRLCGKVLERNKFLTAAFKGCKPAPEGFHQKLAKYPWEYIFTLNIDDLVENIYRTAEIPLSVWDASNTTGTNYEHKTNLVKLHGSVNDSKNGYIFDSSEYKDFTIDSNSLLKEFAHQFLQHDLILIGTEFQEDDLQTVLDVYERSGYSKDPFHRFYISPNISTKLKLQIQNSPNDVWIKCDTKTFLDELDKVVFIPLEGKSYLSEKGAVFLEDISRSTPSSFAIYRGFDSIYPDFFRNADILHIDLERWKNDISSSKSHVLMSFYGESYVGKTCFAKRLLVELFYEGYVAFQLNRFDDKIFDLLISYFKSLPEKTRVAIYLDNAAYHYKKLIELKNSCPLNIEKLVIISEDTIENHIGKEYLLLDDFGSIPCFITATMNDKYATAIYEKLSRNNRLNKYLQCLPTKMKPFSRKGREVIVKKISGESDIIDALYYSTEGTHFQTHYKRWLDRYSSDEERKLLYELCYLFRLGVISVPSPFVTKLGKQLNKEFCLEIFCEKFSEVVSMSYGWVRLHRGRILNHLIDNDDTPLIKNVLHEAAVYAVPSDERIHTQATEIFEKVLRVKHMRNSSLLPREEILDLLKGLENNCNHVSYFWVQYGIAAQINEEYEEANNHLLYAHSMRSKSYHVNHALANNELAWGLFLLKNKIGDGNTKFLNGADRMLKIVYNENFSGSYRYSVHSYVRMWLEYAKVTKENLPYETCEACSNLLESLLDRPLDNMLTTLIKSFIAYCDSNNLKELNFKLKSVYRKREQFHADRGAYDID